MLLAVYFFPLGSGGGQYGERNIAVKNPNAVIFTSLAKESKGRRESKD